MIKKEIQSKVKYIEINKILQFVNVFILIYTIIYYLNNGLPRLLNASSILLYVLLALQISTFLIYEKLKKNPFIVLLCIINIFFISTRIFTIQYNEIFDYSGVLNRINLAKPEDINIALIYIFTSNWAIFFGVVGYKNSSSTNEQSVEISAGSHSKRLKSFNVLFLILIVFSLVGINTNGVWGILNYIFSPFNALLISVYFLSDCKSSIAENRNKKIILLILIAVYLTIITVNGSRAALILFAQLYIYCSLATGSLKISKRLLIFSPLAIVLAIYLFGVATAMRGISLAEPNNNLIERVRQGYEFISSRDVSDDLILAAVPAFDRAGFLDPTVDLIKNAEHYKNVINLASEFKSIVDSALTPGFDVFNIAKMSNALSGVYNNEPARLSRSNELSYQSDQLSVYGEYYLIFYGWLSLPFIYFSALAFTKVYNKICGIKNHELRIICASYVLSLFYNWIISYGLDWIITYILLDVISLYLFLKIIKLKLVLMRST